MRPKPDEKSLSRVLAKMRECTRAYLQSGPGKTKDGRSNWTRAALWCVLVTALAACVSEMKASEPAPAAGGAEGAAHSRRAVLLELFTSEGCSSCPPADVLLAEVATDRHFAGFEVVPLAFHVDYWDWLGWKDPYSSAEFSRRQRDYARRLPEGRVYTPQLIVDGAVGVVGSDRAGVLAAARSAAEGPKATVRLSTTAIADELSGPLSVHVRIEPWLGAIVREPVEVLLALTEDGLVSEITRGENKGRRLAHTGVVRWVTSLGEWDVSCSEGITTTAQIPLPPNWNRRRLNLVGWLQERSLGHVVGSTSLKLSPSGSGS